MKVCRLSHYEGHTCVGSVTVFSYLHIIWWSSVSLHNKYWCTLDLCLSCYTCLKPPEHSLGIKMEKKIWRIQKYLNNCVIMHKLKVPCASFEENCAQNWTLGWRNVVYHICRIVRPNFKHSVDTLIAGLTNFVVFFRPN